MKEVVKMCFLPTFCSAVPGSKEDADQSNRIPEREECPPLHARTVGPSSVSSRLGDWNSNSILGAEKGGNKKKDGT